MSDVHYLPFSDSALDVVFLDHFLCHFPDWLKLLKAKALVCRPGGDHLELLHEGA
ncbi:MAG: class I SAM-dependent methyltransferase [Prosthecobacter sp.]|nr:class I SAM-dependent methyltransferase [Prosthecobacter sp.]